MGVKLRATWHTVAVTIMLVWVLASGLYLAWNDSMTTDEGIHIGSGYLALTRRDFRFDPEHPFLFKELSAVPILLLKPHLPASDQALWNKSEPTFYDSWREARAWSDDWFFRSGNNDRLMLFMGRLPAVICLVALAWMVYLLGKKWFSPHVGLYALVFMAFNPTVLAHGHLANTDVPVSLAILVSIFFLWRYLNRSTLRNLLWLGLVVGIAQLVKFSAVGLLPILFLVFLYQARKSRKYWQTLGHFMLIPIIAWGVIWTAYLFKSPLILDQNTENIGQFLHNRGTLNLAQVESISKVLRYILPSPYAKGLIMVQVSTVYGRGAYLLGHFYFPSNKFYFPVMFALKTQLVVLLVLGYGLLRQLRKGESWRPQSLASGLIALVLISLIIFSIANKLNLGIRHILPIMPFLGLAFGGIMANLTLFKRVRLLMPILLAAYIVPVLIQFPNLLGYVNVLVQPYSKTYAYMNDSNVDWGQQGHYLARFMETRYYARKVYANYPWNPYVLEAAGLPTMAFDPDKPPKNELIVLTATQLTEDKYAAFRQLTPLDHLANNSFIYYLR